MTDEDPEMGGSIEPVHNAVTQAEIPVNRGAKALLVLPLSPRRQLLDLSDDMAAKIEIQDYKYATDALLKAIAE